MEGAGYLPTKTLASLEGFSPWERNSVGVTARGGRRDELAADVQVVVGGFLDNEEVVVEGEGEVDRES
jgi:hypothetical protein